MHVNQKKKLIEMCSTVHEDVLKLLTIRLKA